ncbi:nocturnin [Cimex lectularius]|uniref:Nocturnin n=1 Tax=Cimex lectularius TaxID=79782 RepID=A0A8I6RKH5_CIMLE|nr:nocturnin [Cimex lectularius]
MTLARALRSCSRMMRMGSFTSAPKILNEDTEDNDVQLPDKMSKEELLKYCSSQIGGSILLQRPFKSAGIVNLANYKSEVPPLKDPSSVRVLQWNLLSQTLGLNNDNFVCCPVEALHWQRRRNLLTQEIVRFSPDIICLQEVDHFNYLKKVLGTQGYEGMFFPKPDSPCMYIKENNGPDGCAIFFRTNKFELIKAVTRILEVWKVQSNQVALLAILRNRSCGTELCVATTHLKARNGALLAALRNEQGKDLLEFISSEANGRPVILCGDFNAEPIEPVYSSITSHPGLRLASAYCTSQGEPPYTTWKVRQEGEVCHTLDYIFYSKGKFKVNDVLQFPTSEQIGINRVPSFFYPSDHFSLVSDLNINQNLLNS